MKYEVTKKNLESFNVKQNKLSEKAFVFYNNIKIVNSIL